MRNEQKKGYPATLAESHREMAGADLILWSARMLCIRPEPAAGSNPARVTDSKKAPLGRLSTLVGRAGFEPATN